MGGYDGASCVDTVYEYKDYAWTLHPTARLNQTLSSTAVMAVDSSAFTEC